MNTKSLKKAYSLGLEYGKYHLKSGLTKPTENYNRPNPYSSFASEVAYRIEWRKGYFAAFDMLPPI
jgi:hypothetical protein